MEAGLMKRVNNITLFLLFVLALLAVPANAANNISEQNAFSADEVYSGNSSSSTLMHAFLQYAKSEAGSGHDQAIQDAVNASGVNGSVFYNTTGNLSQVNTAEISGNSTLCSDDTCLGSEDDKCAEINNSNNFSESSGISLSSSILPAVSMEITPDIVNFGTLAAGDSSDVHTLKIFNKGYHEVYVTAEVMDVADDLYVDGLKLDNSSWNVFSAKVCRGQKITTSLQLEVPDDYTGIGSMEGKLVYWAETKENTAPVLEHIGDRTVSVNDTLKITLSASDKDEDTLYYSTDASGGRLAGKIFTWNVSTEDMGVHQVTFTVSDGYLQDSETINITVTAKDNNNDTHTVPFSNFTANISSGTAPLVVQFTDFSENVSSWKWDFGDGCVSSDRNPVHTYNTEGNYTVSLNASNGMDYDIKEVNDFIQVYQENTTDSDKKSGSGNSNSNSRADSQSSDSDTDTNSSDSNVTDDTVDSRMFSVSTDVNANVLPTVSIEITPNSIDFGTLAAGESSDKHSLTILNKGSFRVYVTAEVIDAADNLYVNGLRLDNKSWDLFSKEIQREKEITTSVQLVVPENYIGIGSMEGKLIYWAEAADNNAPVLESIGDRDASVNDTLQIILSASDADDDTLHYSTNASRGKLVNNIFTWEISSEDVGTHQLIFIVSDGQLHDSETIQVTVHGAGDNSSEIKYHVSDFKSNVTSGKAPLAVQFIDLSENASSWEWDFGDGYTSTDKTPVHIYENYGNYTVSLKTGNDAGFDVKEAENFIQVYPPVIISMEEPSSPDVTDYAGNYRLFSVSTDITADITWILDNDRLYTNQSVRNASYYSVAKTGGHNVTVLAESAGGRHQISWNWTVTENTTSASSGSSSGSKSYSASSSGESYDNIFYKEAKSLNVLARKLISYGFSGDANPVVYINFESLKNAGVVTASVEVLNSVSETVTSTPPGVIYRNLHILVGRSGFSSQGNIENCMVGFRVPKSWIQSNQIDDSSVTLYRYNSSSWSPMSTHLTKEDEDYLYYEASIPGFSPFAISADQKPEITEEKTEILMAPAEYNVSELSNTSLGESIVPKPERKSYSGIVFIFLLIGLVVSAYAVASKRDIGHILTFKSGKNENVYFKESQEQDIAADSSVTYNFNSEENPVTYVRFISRHDSGKTTAKAELLRKTSILVRQDPPGKVCKNLNLWLGDGSFTGMEGIEQILIGFKIENVWLEEYSVAASSVRLLRYGDGNWNVLDTGKIREDETYSYFESQAYGFGAFAITVQDEEGKSDRK